MTRLHIIPTAVIAVILAAPSVGLAQDWLGRLARSAAETAARGVVNNAVSGAVNDGARQGSTAHSPAPEPAATSIPVSQRQAPRITPASSFANPAPINYTSAMRNPNDMRFGPEHEAAKKAYEDFGKVDCNDCEGGYAYETWIRHARRELMGFRVLENRIGGMAIGGSLEWTGSRGARYALTVVGEQPVGAWPCKQVKWTGDRGAAHAERMGLYCQLNNNWMDVF